MSVRPPYLLRSGTSGRTIVLNLEPEHFRGFPDTIRLKEITLLKKDEFHVTLVHVRQASERAKLPILDFESKSAGLFESFIEQNPVNLISFLDDFRYVEEGEKKTVVVRCIISNFSKLFAVLNETFGIDMPTQPAHVTLYTLQKNVGIHVNSDEKMESLERVRLPALEAALKQTGLV